MRQTMRKLTALILSLSLLLIAASCAANDKGTAPGQNGRADSLQGAKVQNPNVPEIIPQEVAEYYGLSAETNDTDADGIPDNIEIYALGSDPLTADGALDTDADGLSNYDEINVYGTDAGKPDTDLDGLSDYDELFVYGSSPVVADTDADGICDGDEIRLGTDPLSPTELTTVFQTLPEDSMAEELLAGDNSAQPSLSGTASQVLSRSVTLKAAAGEEILSNRAIVGKAVCLDMAEDMDASLTLGFAAEEENDSLVIMHRTDGAWTPLETTHSPEGLSASVTAGGTYCVMDLGVLLPMLGVDVNACYEEAAAGQHFRQTLIQAKGQADIVFVIDTTGSMSDEIENVAENITAFETAIREEYDIYANFALVRFGDSTVDEDDAAQVVDNNGSNWFADSESFRSAVEDLTLGDGGDLAETSLEALEFSRRLDYRSDAKKFVILLTDDTYKIDNCYGVVSMEREIELMTDSGIVVTAVTPEQFRDDYIGLCQATGGEYADLNADFQEVLRSLIAVVAEETEKENWILLDDYQYVMLNEPLSADSGCDTDGDGVSDYDELEPPTKVSIDNILMQMLVAQGLTQEQIMEYFATEDGAYLTVYPYKSNPGQKDTDFDGISDKKDAAPRDNTFTGTLVSGSFDGTPMDYSFDYRTFFGSNTTYSSWLCETSLLYSSYMYNGYGFTYDTAIAYDASSSEVTSTTSASTLLKIHGMENVVDYKLSKDYTDDDITEVVIGHHCVSYNGETKQIIAVAVRGTNGTIEEWSSNFDLGDRSKFSTTADWTHYDNHKGFDVTATRVQRYLEAYVEKYIAADDATVFWVTGHSRGAAVANILSASLIDNGQTVFSYTFAAPNTTLNASAKNAKYKCIFNLVNEDDFVPCVPMTNWGFNRFGVTAVIDMTSDMENEYHSVTGSFWYNQMSASNLQGVINSLSAVASDWDACYTYTCSCHGDGTNDDIIESGLSASDLENISERCSKYYKKATYSNWLGQTKYRCCQLPAYFMQAMADIIAANGLGGQFSALTGYHLAEQYEGARTKLVWAATLGGITDPHYCETYYVLTRHLSASDYK